MKALNTSAISISLVLCLLSGAPKMAAAASVGLDINSFETIAAAHATESKCRQLSQDDREELATHAAYAETAAAKTNGSASVKAARKRAKSSASCGGNARGRVLAGLSAGRKFEQKFVDQRKAAARVAARKRKRKERRKVRRQAALAPRTVAPSRVDARTTPRQARGSIARYRSHTRAYYLQRRCNHLPYKQALRFWKLIAAQHGRMVRRYGGTAVAKADRQARRSARRARCSPATKRQVIAGLRAIRQGL
ncbi:MAG: hypothetical protein AAGF81_15565 [Pseudomonadota bacterium]